MEGVEVALGGLTRDERSAAVARVVDSVDVTVCDVVHSGGCDVARPENERCEKVVPGEPLETSGRGGAEQQEHPDHCRDAVPQHPDEEEREVAHFGMTTLSGHTVVTTRM